MLLSRRVGCTETGHWHFSELCLFLDTFTLHRGHQHNRLFPVSMSAATSEKYILLSR